MIDCEYIFDQIYFSPVFSRWNTYFLKKVFFSIESFPTWKMDLKFPYDANTLRNITLKYIFYNRLLESKT